MENMPETGKCQHKKLNGERCKANALIDDRFQVFAKDFFSQQLGQSTKVPDRWSPAQSSPRPQTGLGAVENVFQLSRFCPCLAPLLNCAKRFIRVLV